MDSKIEKSIIKFLTKEANLEELRALELWISNPKNEALFKEYIKTNAFANRIYIKYDKKSAKENIGCLIKQQSNNAIQKRYGIIKYAAAAIVIGFLFTGYFYKDGWFTVNSPEPVLPIVTPNTILPGTDSAILTLEDGSSVMLEEGKNLQTKNASSNGKQIVYKTKGQKTKEVVYNYLTIPRGKQYHVVLSDSTTVWLNSESQLKYPIEFIDGSPREVELVYGEAYFEVSPSSKHKGSKFIVMNQEQKIEVLGTAFNIKAYKDESNIYTTLVEGKVAIDYHKKTQILKPSEQANINVESNAINVYQVDVNTEVSWKNGLFIFKGKSLKSIMKVLSRWYDIDVVFMNKELERIKFNGVLGRDQNMEEILTIMKTNTIDDYQINQGILILK
jgi:hypothetical protein